MKGLGTIINVIAILAGSSLGILIKGGMQEKLQNMQYAQNGKLCRKIIAKK